MLIAKVQSKKRTRIVRNRKDKNKVLTFIYLFMLGFSIGVNIYLICNILL